MSFNKFLFTDIYSDIMEHEQAMLTFPYCAIVSADYMEYENMPFIEMQTEVLKDFNARLIKWCNEHANPPYIAPLPDNYVLKYDQILILWKNVPLHANIDSYNDKLIDLFCKKHFKQEYDGVSSQLFIDNVNTLAMGSMDDLLKKLLLIYNNNHIRPIFMSETPYFKYDKESFLKEISQLGAFTPDEHMGDDFVYGANAFFYKHMMETYSMLLANIDAAPSLFDYGNRFIDLYFKWQMGERTVQSASEELGNPKNPDKPTSKSMFYNMAESLEQSPVYAEFLKLYPELSTRERIGATANIKDFMDCYNNTVKDEKDFEGKYEMCVKYNFVSFSDLNRNYLSYKKKSESTRRHKNL